MQDDKNMLAHGRYLGTILKNQQKFTMASAGREFESFELLTALNFNRAVYEFVTGKPLDFTAETEAEYQRYPSYFKAYYIWFLVTRDAALHQHQKPVGLTFSKVEKAEEYLLKDDVFEPLINAISAILAAYKEQDRVGEQGEIPFDTFMAYFKLLDWDKGAGVPDYITTFFDCPEADAGSSVSEARGPSN